MLSLSREEENRFHDHLKEKPEYCITFVFESEFLLLRRQLKAFYVFMLLLVLRLPSQRILCEKIMNEIMVYLKWFLYRIFNKNALIYTSRISPLYICHVG